MLKPIATSFLTGNGHEDVSKKETVLKWTFFGPAEL